MCEARESINAILIEKCVETPGYLFIIDDEPWFNAAAIEGFTGISLRTLQMRKIPRHPLYLGYYRMSDLTPKPARRARGKAKAKNATD